ncbi:MAG: hypothetical protein R6V05_00165 [Candidatus Brocadiia bacterium]
MRVYQSKQRGKYVKYAFGIVFLFVVVFASFKLIIGGPYRQGVRLFEKGDYTAAEDKFEAALGSDSRRGDSLVYLARIKGIKDDPEAGVKLCDQAAALDETDPLPLYYKAILLQLAGRVSESERVIDKLAKLPQMGVAMAVGELGGFHQDGVLTPPEIAHRQRLLKGKKDREAEARKAGQALKVLQRAKEGGGDAPQP